ncbi:MAG: hypothetical protein E6Y12_09880 [Dermabacter sp.]|uniref:hypothetical protein n=1 Tax=Dermabacter hominis TaxID=36740 RepID=UPI0021A77DBE|nr:hypothetical protein [Dermabacter hominis]MCT1789567.1 hypothetical protein [Dermabacter hominis]MDU4693960.1 hypothetical protein [Dermabacter sp.]
MLKMKNPAAATAELHKDNFVVKPTRNDVAPQSINSQLQQPPARLQLGKKLFSELPLFCRSSNLFSKGRRSKNISELRTRARDLGLVSRALTTVDFVDFAATVQVGRSAKKTTETVVFSGFRRCEGGAGCEIS